MLLAHIHEEPAMSHIRHHPHTWALIRDDYLAGQTREVLAEQYGVGESTIRDRARKEGWRRVDQEPSDAASDWDEAAEAEPMRPTRAIIADAYRFADLAMRRGRPAEAQRYLSVAKGFERLNRPDPLTRSVHDYWSDEEKMLIDTARLREEWAAAMEAAATPKPPLPPEPSDLPEPPNPPNPPTIERAEPAEAAPRPPPNRPIRPRSSKPQRRSRPLRTPRRPKPRPIVPRSFAEPSRAASATACPSTTSPPSCAAWRARP
jgi:hypothetical protein